MEAYDLSVQHFRTSLEIFPRLYGADYTYLLSEMGIAYMKAREWGESYHYFQRGIQGRWEAKDTSGVASPLNNMGILYLEKGDLDSADFYFGEALTHYQTYPANDTLFPGSIRDNLARVAKRKGQYGKAMTYYQRNLKTYQHRRGRKLAGLVQAQVGAAEMHLHLGQPTKAKPLLDDAGKLLPSVLPKFREELEEDWLRQQVEYAIQKKDASLLKQSVYEFSAFKDSLEDKLRKNIEKSFHVQALLKARDFRKDQEIQRLKINEERAKVANLKVQARYTRIWITFGIVTFLLILLLAYRWYRYRSERFRRQLELNTMQAQYLLEKVERERLDKENLELNLSLKDQDLTNFALDNQRKRELLQQLGERLKTLKPEQITRGKIREILNEMMLQLQGESSSILFQDKVDVVNSEFRSRLLERFPGLTQYEIELCGMVRLGMQIKEIAAHRNVTEGAIQQARKRLRKKLDLQRGDDLQVFLRGV